MSILIMNGSMITTEDPFGLVKGEPFKRAESVLNFEDDTETSDTESISETIENEFQPGTFDNALNNVDTARLTSKYLATNVYDSYLGMYMKRCYDFHREDFDEVSGLEKNGFNFDFGEFQDNCRELDYIRSLRVHLSIDNDLEAAFKYLFFSIGLIAQCLIETGEENISYVIEMFKLIVDFLTYSTLYQSHLDKFQEIVLMLVTYTSKTSSGFIYRAGVNSIYMILSSLDFNHFMFCFDSWFTVNEEMNASLVELKVELLKIMLTSLRNIIIEDSTKVEVLTTKIFLMLSKLENVKGFRDSKYFEFIEVWMPIYLRSKKGQRQGQDHKYKELPGTFKTTEVRVMEMMESRAMNREFRTQEISSPACFLVAGFLAVIGGHYAYLISKYFF